MDLNKNQYENVRHLMFAESLYCMLRKKKKIITEFYHLNARPKLHLK